VAKKAKYPAQKLTEEDKELIGQLALKYIAASYALIGKYPKPKDYAENVILKIFRSKNDLAVLHVLSVAKNATPSHLHKPREIKQLLVNTIQSSVRQDFKDMKSVQEFLEYLNLPRELRKALRGVEDMGAFDHLTKKDEIRNLERGTRHAGKKPSYYEDDRDLGGNPSSYKKRGEFEKLKNVMEKPGAIELFYERLARSDLAYKLVKFQQLALWYAVKMDETLLSKMIGHGICMFPEIKGKHISDFKNAYQQLQSFDESQLEKLAEHCAKILIKNPGSLQSFAISVFGLPGF
jgi:hypothetical protein